MTERKEIQLPPSWCGAICRNAMNEVCIEHCAIKRDCSAFDPKPKLKLGDLPRFPLEASASMTKEEKFTSVTVYLAKVVDHLNGVSDEQKDLRFSTSLPATNFGQIKVIAEIAAGMQRELSDAERSEVKNMIHQPTETNSEIGSEK
jgi:hypothetical protein